MNDEKRMAGSYEIKLAIHIGDKEIVYGENMQDKDGQFYFVGNYTHNDLLAQYDNNGVSGDYLEIMQEFTDRVNRQIEAVRAERDAVSVPLTVFTADHCYPNDLSQSIDGKVVAIKADVFRREYRRGDQQIVLVSSGSGAQANARGRTVFYHNLYTGKHGRTYRNDIQGELKPECTPAWVKERLTAIQSEKTKEKRHKGEAR